MIVNILTEFGGGVCSRRCRRIIAIQDRKAYLEKMTDSLIDRT
jgi:hypothetical protein